MRAAGRSKWSRDDYGACVLEFNRLSPDEPTPARSTAEPDFKAIETREVWMSRAEALKLCDQYRNRHCLPRRGRSVTLGTGIELYNVKGKYRLLDASHAAYAAEVYREARKDQRERRIELGMKLLESAAGECEDLGDGYRNSNITIRAILKTLNADYGEELGTLVTAAVKQGDLTGEEILELAVDAYQKSGEEEWHKGKYGDANRYFECADKIAKLAGAL